MRGDNKTRCRPPYAPCNCSWTRSKLQPELQLRAAGLVAETLVQSVDITTLLADFGFAPRTAFVSELAERLRRKLLPGTPETIDASELFPLVFSSARRTLRPRTMDGRALAWSRRVASGSRRCCRPAPNWTRLHWHYILMDAITYCTAQIRPPVLRPSCACA
jgi:hypothetical protein